MPENDSLPKGEGKAGRPGVPAYGAPSTPLAAPTPRLGRGAENNDGPPVLTGSRLGPPPPGDRAAAAFRARYQPEPIPFQPRKRSKALVAGIVAGALLVLGGGVFAAGKVLTSYDDFVANPLGTPSVKTPGYTPSDQEPAGKPIDDVAVLQKNALYTTGALAPVKCKEPNFRPSSKENVRSYYQALMVCLEKFWKPVVVRSGHEFHPPKLIIFDDGQETACGVQEDVSSYCAADGGSVALPWEDRPDEYSSNRSLTRVDLAGALSYVYAVHVQNLTGIFDSVDNKRSEAATEALRLEQSRRMALQANCLSAGFLGAEKATFPITGDLLTWWKWRSRNNGDETDPGKVRDHGSRKSVELWMNKGFAAPNPGSCNTFVAAAAKVS
ncbi:neutral zinc metallopeptidase [Kribbella sp. CA-293567]|uniref:neutral zinc metallopeptidase n=1 Tax=Kribbella sp. CA-293567 TaxID=3002436 RepID=UPI0022DDDC09|nr:neutral zinc metallopeptidase [Kribbella sp. CA-293567]WBQ04301.1 neutral zinc metallopeptidase [Kribbella sp. CA-293567]